MATIKASPALARLVAGFLIRELEKLWTIQDVADHLKINVSNLRPSRRGNKIPPPDIREGNFVRWLPETIYQFEKDKNKFAGRKPSKSARG